MQLDAVHARTQQQVRKEQHNVGSPSMHAAMCCMSACCCLALQWLSDVVQKRYNRNATNLVKGIH